MRLIFNSFILLLVFVALTGCRNNELQQQLDTTKERLASTQNTLDECVNETGELRDELERVCQAVDTRAENFRPKSVDITEDAYTPLPCMPDYVRVKLFKVDEQRGWAYLKYEVSNNVRFSHPMPFDSDDKYDRNVLLIRESNISEPILLTVGPDCKSDDCYVTCSTISYDRISCDLL